MRWSVALQLQYIYSFAIVCEFHKVYKVKVENNFHESRFSLFVHIFIVFIWECKKILKIFVKAYKLRTDRRSRTTWLHLSKQFKNNFLQVCAKIVMLNYTLLRILCKNHQYSLCQLIKLTVEISSNIFHRFLNAILYNFTQRKASNERRSKIFVHLLLQGFHTFQHNFLTYKKHWVDSL